MDMDIPPEWEQINTSRLNGALLIIGAPDVGKSTFARFLYQQLQATSRCTAYLDGDPGQSRLGPPTTMTLAMGMSGNEIFPPRDRIWRTFVGGLSPVRHMLPVVVGAARLVQAARDAGAQVIVYDTTGLIDPDQGGAYLKMAKIDLLHPTVVFAIQYINELEYLLAPLRRSRRVYVVDMSPPLAAQRRDPATRRDYRAGQFARYFENVNQVTVKWSNLAVFPAPVFTINRLVALEDSLGFTLGLGIVLDVARESRQMVLLTPVPSMEKVDAIQLGDVALDPETFQTQPVRKYS